MDKISVFLRDVRVELGRVSWPTRKQTLQYTYVVIGMSILLALFLGALDALFAIILNRFIIQ